MTTQELPQDFHNPVAELERYRDHCPLTEESTKNASEALGKIKNLFREHRGVLAPDQLQRLENLLHFYSASSIKEDISTKLINHIFHSSFQNTIKTGKDLYVAVKDSRLIQNSYQDFIRSQPNPTKDLIKNFIFESRRENPRAFCTYREELDIWVQEATREHCSDVLEMVKSITFSPREIKNGANSIGLYPNLQGSIDDLNDGTILEITEDAVTNKIHELREQRSYRLQNIDIIYRDLFETRQEEEKKTFSITSKYFPFTAAWFIGGDDTGGTARDSEIEMSMETFAKHLDIKMISDISSTSRNLTFFTKAIQLRYGEKGSHFPQDFFDCGFDELRVGRLKENSNEIEEMNDAMVHDRRRRNPLWRIDDDSVRAQTENNIRGLAFEEEKGKKAIALGIALRVSLSMNLTYSEGGNTLIGKDRNGPFAIIGSDSFAASKYLLEKDLHQPLTDEQIKKAFALDYGIPTEKIYFIEQPGDYHLDMNMCLLGERKIAIHQSEHGISDPELQLYTAQGSEGMRRWKRGFEDQVAESLKTQGFSIVKIKGRFYKENGDETMNFFNHLTGTTLTNAGEKKPFLIAMGFNDQYKEKFLQFTKKFQQKIPEENIFFLPLEVSEACLQRYGGLACKTKVFPLIWQSFR